MDRRGKKKEEELSLRILPMKHLPSASTSKMPSF
jgi:hypothetical protein